MKSVLLTSAALSALAAPAQLKLTSSGSTATIVFEKTVASSLITIGDSTTCTKIDGSSKCISDVNNVELQTIRDYMLDLNTKLTDQKNLNADTDRARSFNHDCKGTGTE